MKRSAFAMGAAMLLLGLMPGSTLALGPSNLDQSNIPPNQDHQAGASQELCQTFTARNTGMLSRVDLYLNSDGQTTRAVELYATDPSTGLPSGSLLATGSLTVSNEVNWYPVSFAQPASVTSGVVYAIVIPDTGNLDAFGSIGSRAGGKAYTSLEGWIALDTIDDGPSDLGFKIYVDTVTTQLVWDKASVTAGVPTSLTLTVTMKFANGDEASGYQALLAVPTWFTVTAITCPTGDLNGPCTVDYFNQHGGIGLEASPDGAVLTFSLVGTAAPALSDVGSGTATGEACLVYLRAVAPSPSGGLEPSVINVVHPNAPSGPGCVSGTAAVQVVAPADPTPTPAPAATPTPFQAVEGATAAPTVRTTLPPTSAGAGPGSDGTDGAIWLLPMGLLAFFGGAFALVIRRRRLA